MKITRFAIHSQIQAMLPNEGLWCDADVQMQPWDIKASVEVEVECKNTNGKRITKFVKQKTLYWNPFRPKRHVVIVLIETTNNVLEPGDTLDIVCGSFKRFKRVYHLTPPK